MAKTFTCGALKPALLSKTSGRKSALKTATEIGGLVAKAGQNDLLPSLKVENRDTATVKLAAKRVRKPKAALVKTLVATMSMNGFLVPMLVRGDELVDGHARLAAARELSLPTVPVIDISHLSPEQCEVVKLAVNRTQELGEWDVEILREVVLELSATEFDLTVTGFTAPELDFIVLDPTPELSSDLNKVPDEATNVTSMLGDLWTLGDHLLLCGSATEAGSYEALLGEDKVAMVLTDPPYNVKIAGNVSGLGKKAHGEFVQATGEMTDEEFRAWLATFCGVLRPAMSAAAVAMMFMDWRHMSDLIGAGLSAGFNLINMVVWDKQRGGMGGLYRSAHELVAVFCNGATSPAVNNVKLGAHGRDRSNMWSYPGATTPGSSAAKALSLHPTPKPVELLVDAMRVHKLTGQRNGAPVRARCFCFSALDSHPLIAPNRPKQHGSGEQGWLSATLNGEGGLRIEHVAHLDACYVYVKYV